MSLANYKSIEVFYLPPGEVNSVEEFKDMVLDQVHKHMEAKKLYSKEKNIPIENTPLPIGMYVLYKDFSVRTCLLFPHSTQEKQMMVLAMKKQLKEAVTYGGVVANTEYIYGAFTSEIWMAQGDASKLESRTQEKAVEDFKQKYMEGKLERVTRVLVQFENALTKTYECKLYSILDPGILVEQDKESELFSESLTEQAQLPVKPGIEPTLMASLFDYSPEYEMNLIGKVQDSVHFSLNEALKFIQDLLEEEKQYGETRKNFFK